MNALQGLDRYWKEVIHVSTRKHDINVQYHNNKIIFVSRIMPLL